MDDGQFEQSFEIEGFLSCFVSGLQGDLGDVVLGDDSVWGNNHPNLFMILELSVMIQDFTTWHGYDFWAEEIGLSPEGVLQRLHYQFMFVADGTFHRNNR